LVVTRDTVGFSGGSFDVRPTGVCLDNIPIVIRDTSGHTTTVTVSNVLGTAAVPPLDVSPDAVTLTTCGSTAVVTAVGGTGNYIGSSGSDAIYVNRIQNSFFQIGRLQNGARPPAGTVLVGISDGLTTKNVTVTLSGQAAGVCPAPAFDAQPRTVTLTSCTGTATVNLSGGSGVYSASSNSSAVKATISGNTLSIGRNSGPRAGVGSFVQASDGISSPISITIDDQTVPTTCP
jgi:hypothetical protein